MSRAHGILILALTVGLAAAACSRAGDESGKAARVGVGTYLATLEQARVAFIGVPSAVPDVARQLAVEFPRHPPLDRDTALLASAARVGFSSGKFDAAIAATPAPRAIPGTSTLSALGKFAAAYAHLQAVPAGGAQRDDAARLAPLLPTIMAARERGLALDRINLLAESTRNDPDVVNALAPSTLSSGGSELMTYSRENIGREDEAWGGNQHAQVTTALERTSAALNVLEPGEVAAIQKWYESPGGHVELAWTSAMLTRAYDAAGEAMTKDYFRRIKAYRVAPRP